MGLFGAEQKIKINKAELLNVRHRYNSLLTTHLFNAIINQKKGFLSERICCVSTYRLINPTLQPCWTGFSTLRYRHLALGRPTPGPVQSRV